MVKLFSKLTTSKKVLIEGIADFVAIFFLITILYLLFFLMPTINSAKSLRIAKEHLYANNLMLQKEKVAYEGLINIKADDPLITTQISSILKVIENVWIDILEEKENTKILTNKKDVKKLLMEIIKSQSELILEGKNIVNDKKPILERYKKIYSIVQKIFEYNPNTDLSNLADLDTIMERTLVTATLLTEISDNLKKEKLQSEETVLLFDELSKNISLLNQISIAAKTHNHDKLKSLTGTLSTEYPKLRKEAKTFLDSPLKSKKSVEILNDQANLILEYKYWIEKIDEKQNTLETDPLSNIFKYSLR